MCCPASEGVFADSLAEVVRVRGDAWEMSRVPDGRARRARRLKVVVDMLAECDVFSGLMLVSDKWFCCLQNNDNRFFCIATEMPSLKHGI